MLATMSAGGRPIRGGAEEAGRETMRRAAGGATTDEEFRAFRARSAQCAAFVAASRRVNCSEGKN